MTGRFLTFLALFASFGLGCAHPAGHAEVSQTVHADSDAVFLDATAKWTDSPFILAKGDAVDISAIGWVRDRLPTNASETAALWSDPAGTYLVPTAHDGSSDPLPSGSHGPAPAMALVARIGDGQPFLVGRRAGIRAATSGRLQFRVNDSTPDDNAGHFSIHVDRVTAPSPMGHETVLTAPARTLAPPSPAKRVLIFYIDGLRADVVREMALTGHLPTIRRLFVEGGSWLQNTTTVFPSSTLTANGSMWTGCFPDRHGLTSMIRFDRRTQTSQSHLSTLGPVRAAESLRPVGILGLASTANESIHSAVGASVPDSASEDVATPLYTLLNRQGTDWATGVLPIMPHLTPPLWSRSLLRHLPFLRADKAWQHFDDANTTYALRHLVDLQRPVTVIWLPETDSVSHTCGRGQFGATRQTLAQADILIGSVVDHLDRRGQLDDTVLMLVSDHGHHGGRHQPLKHFDVAHEVFFRTRTVSQDHHWLSGGLGLSVHQHQSTSRHPHDKHFVFVDSIPDGTCRIYLPRSDYRSQDWTSSARPADLLNYRISDHLPPINLIQRLINAQAEGPDDNPVDMALVRNTPDSLLLISRTRGAAVITRRRDSQRRHLFRYQVVNNLGPAPDGSIAWKAVTRPTVDPLHLVTHASTEFLAREHDEQAWLTVMKDSQYPDAVVSLARSMLWVPSIDSTARHHAPDIVLTASRGWYFGKKPTAGTMHGHPLRDAMFSTWFVSGRGIRKNTRITTPCRLTDLTPTILDCLGRLPVDQRFDGRPIRQFHETATPAPKPSPITRADVLLTDWSAIETSHRPSAEELPRTVNAPHSPSDVNTVIHNVASLPSWNPMRLFDDLLHGPHAAGVTSGLEQAEDTARTRLPGRWHSTPGVFRLSDLAFSDYNPTSDGNLFRIDRLVDSLQSASGDRPADQAVGSRPGPLAPLHRMIDGLQTLRLEISNSGQRILVEAVDDSLAGWLESVADLVINTDHRVPAEIVVPLDAEVVRQASRTRSPEPAAP